MDCKQRRGLIALNLGLLGVLALVSMMPQANAQQAVTRNRGDYTMIGGRASGIPESVLWIIDGTNQEMVVLRYEQGSKSLRPIGYRNIAADINQSRGGRGGR
jgi:hypothetical protein